MLEHSYTDNFVERVCLNYIPIITHLHTAFPHQSHVPDTFLCQFSLRFAKCDSICLYSIMLCSIDHQPAPTTPNIQQSLTWTQAQLVADIIELAFLGRV